MNLKEIKELDLQNNNISDIKVLQNVKFNKIEILDLIINEITNINILKKVKFNKLKTFDLSNNKINKEIFNPLLNNLKTKILEFIV